MIQRNTIKIELIMRGYQQKKKKNKPFLIFVIFLL
jgi:hypothetical protein